MLLHKNLKLYSINEAAKILDVHPKTIYYHYYKNSFPECFVVVKSEAKTKIHVTEEFFDAFLSVHTPQETLSKITDIFYELYGEIMKIAEDEDKAVEIIAEYIRQFNEQRGYPLGKLGKKTVENMLLYHEGIKRNGDQASRLLSLLSEIREGGL